MKWPVFDANCWRSVENRNEIESHKILFTEIKFHKALFTETKFHKALFTGTKSYKILFTAIVSILLLTICPAMHGQATGSFSGNVLDK